VKTQVQTPVPPKKKKKEEEEEKVKDKSNKFYAWSATALGRPVGYHAALSGRNVQSFCFVPTFGRVPS
jgi:hypothetical protein